MKLLIIAAAIGLAATAADILDELSISREEAQQCLLLSIGSGTLEKGKNGNLVSLAKNLSTSAKVAGVRQLIRIAREYSETEAFQKDYKKWRFAKLNPDSKTKLGLPKLGKIIENQIDNQLDKSENQKKYPEQAGDMVKKRLKEFLAVSATVDFDAQLNGSRFVNPEYERKSGQWKMCYRAGREVVAAAREEAAAWLESLEE